MTAAGLAIGASAAAMAACAPPQATCAGGLLMVDVRSMDGAMLLDGQVVDAATVRRRAGDCRVHVRGDTKVTYSQFSSVMKQLEGLNMPVLIGEEAP